MFVDGGGEYKVDSMVDGLEEVGSIRVAVKMRAHNERKRLIFLARTNFQKDILIILFRNQYSR